MGGGGHVGEGAGGGQRVPTLSTGRAGARQRIVHMSTACVCLGGRGFLGVGGVGWRRWFLRKLADLSVSF